jgi:uncharacterized GH25 family protein
VERALNGRRRALRWLRAGAVVGALATVARVALAHDQWLEPEVSRDPGAGSTTLRARLFVGEAPFAEEEKAFERVKLSRLELVSRNGSVHLEGAGVEGARPIGTVSALGDGEFLLVAERSPVRIELAAPKFEAYLTDEGLSHIVRDRASRGESNKPGRERYARYAKALVHVGPTVTHDLATKTLGQKLEINLEPGGRGLRAGTPLEVKITFEGRPLAGAKLQASLRHRGLVALRDERDGGGPSAAGGAGGATDTAHVTDARGRAVVTPGSSGFLVLHLVHMRRCVEVGGAPCADADWESFWGSFTASIE